MGKKSKVQEKLMTYGQIKVGDEVVLKKKLQHGFRCSANKCVCLFSITVRTAAFRCLDKECLVDRFPLRCWAIKPAIRLAVGVLFVSRFLYVV